MPDDEEPSAVSASRDAEYTAYVCARLPSLRRLAMLLCQDWQRADDLVQATITQLYVHWGRASAADHTDAYARTILIREFAHERRSGWARRVRLSGEVTESPAAAVDHEAALDLRTAVAALPPRQRATLVLRYYCDLNVDQSAEVLSCSPGTVKSQTAKALHALRGALETRPAAGTEGRLPAGPGRRSYGEVPDHG
jgi:RNA polymerase sigma-70 factor (sigma-E family)